MDITFYLLLFAINLIIIVISKNVILNALNLLFILFNIYFILIMSPVTIVSAGSVITIEDKPDFLIYPFILLFIIQVFKIQSLFK